MKFLALLMVAIILIWTPWRKGYPKDLLGAWVQYAVRRGRGRIALLVLLLVLIPIGLLLWWLQDRAYGLFALVLHVGLLLSAVGRHDPLGQANREFARLWEQGEPQAAVELARRHLGVAAEEPELLLAALRRRMVTTSLSDYFVPAFWYLLLGPLGAVAYRLLYLARDCRTAAAVPVVSMLTHALEWLPARLLALSFALVGHFDATLRTLRELASDWELSGGQLAMRCAEVALAEAPAAPGKEPGADAVLGNIRQLLIRALLAWAVIVAFFAMLG